MADHFFPEILDWINGKYLEQDFDFDYSRTEEPFDYGSIMMYNSVDGIRKDVSREEIMQGKVPLLRKVRDGKFHNPGSFVWPGGSEHADKARISALDIKRVSQIYPAPDPVFQARAAKLGDKVDKGEKNWELPPGVGAFSIDGYVENWALSPNPFDVAYADEEGNLDRLNLSPQWVERDRLAQMAAAMGNLQVHEGPQGS